MRRGFGPQAGLIAVRQTERTQQYPERTVYELTEEGRRTGLIWLRDMLATPRHEYPVFPVALSFAMSLDPEELKDLLSQRLTAVNARLAPLKRPDGRYDAPLAFRVVTARAPQG